MKGHPLQNFKSMYLVNGYRFSGKKYGFFGQGHGYINFTSLPAYFEDFNLNFRLIIEFKVPVFADMQTPNELLFGNAITTSQRSCFCTLTNTGAISARFSYATQRFQYSSTFNENEWVKIEFIKIGSQLFVYRNDVLDTTLSTVGNTGSSVNRTNLYISAADATPVRPATAIYKNKIILDTLDSGGVFESSQIDADLNIQTGTVVPNNGNGANGGIGNVGGLPVDSWWVEVA